MVLGLRFRMLPQIHTGQIGRLMTGIGHGQTTTESEAYTTTAVAVAAEAPVTKVGFEHVNDCGDAFNVRRLQEGNVVARLLLGNVIDTKDPVTMIMVS